jgi:hypothetical protein
MVRLRVAGRVAPDKASKGWADGVVGADSSL